MKINEKLDLGGAFGGRITYLFSFFSRPTQDFIKLKEFFRLPLHFWRSQFRQATVACAKVLADVRIHLQPFVIRFAFAGADDELFFADRTTRPFKKPFDGGE